MAPMSDRWKHHRHPSIRFYWHPQPRRKDRPHRCRDWKDRSPSRQPGGCGRRPWTSPPPPAPCRCLPRRHITAGRGLDGSSGCHRRLCRAWRWWSWKQSSNPLQGRRRDHRRRNRDWWEWRGLRRAKCGPRHCSKSRNSWLGGLFCWFHRYQPTHRGRRRCLGRDRARPPGAGRRGHCGCWMWTDH